jgi:hypothetical protein
MPRPFAAEGGIRIGGKPDQDDGRGKTGIGGREETLALDAISARRAALSDGS